MTTVSASNECRNFELPEIIDFDRRPTLLSYAASLRARGAEEEEIHAALLEANAQRCRPPLSSTRDLNGLKRIAIWAAKRAKSTRKRLISESDEKRIDQAEHALEEHPWRGIAALNARDVARAVIAKMKADNVADMCVADSRTIADEVGLSRRVVSTALRKLSGVERDKHVLVLFCQHRDRQTKKFMDGRDPVKHAYTYSLRQDQAWSKNSPHFPSYNGTTKTWANFRLSSVHDAFLVRGKGLTKSASIVYDLLPVRVQKDVRKQTGLSLPTVKLAFIALQKEELIEKKDGFWVRTGKSLDVVATKRGTTGAARRQKEQHEHERKCYRSRLAEVPGRKIKMVRKVEEKKIPIDVGPVRDEDYAAYADTVVEFVVPGEHRKKVKNDDSTASVLLTIASDPLSLLASRVNRGLERHPHNR